MSQRILITGGASGLGRALAEYYLDAGARVLITDINEERGEATQFELRPRGEIHFLKADSCSDSDWAMLVEWCQKNWQGLDILYNNAGVAAGGRFDKISMDDWDWIIDINLKAVVRGSKAFTPLFKAQRSGHIVSTASLAAIANAPTMSSYNVTKAAVVSLSETLRYELQSSGINVSVICPGFFQTNLADSMRTPEPALEQSVRKLLAGGSMNAAQVAAYIGKAVAKNRFLILPHREGRMLWRIKRFLPFLYTRGMRQAGISLRKKLERTE